MDAIFSRVAQFSSILIFFATFAVYSPALKGEFLWDDDSHVLHIEKLKSFNGLKKIWFEQGATLEYYPLLFSTFWIERHLFGDNPFGYHAVNILLHYSNAIFLKRILVRLAIPGAVWAAAVFALHPVHVESVAWITERKNCLSVFFYFLSLLAYLRFAGIGVGVLSDSEKRKNYVYAFIYFVAAVLSKTVTCTLPAAFLLLVSWKAKGLKWKQVWPTFPFFMTGICLAIITYWVETRFIGAFGPEWNFNWLDRIVIAGRALWFYVGKILWPHPLIFIYPRWDLNQTYTYQLIFPISFLLLISFVTVGAADSLDFIILFFLTLIFLISSVVFFSFIELLPL